MREIKFRAWDKKWKEMAHFEEMQSRKYKALNVADPSQFILLPKHDNVILMQFTGLKDKNGKEIYEGDIVRWGDTDGVQNSIEWNSHNGAWTGCDAGGVCSDTLWVPEKCEIIGNIYENPELLTEK